MDCPFLTEERKEKIVSPIVFAIALASQQTSQISILNRGLPFARITLLSITHVYARLSLADDDVSSHSSVMLSSRGNADVQQTFQIRCRFISNNDSWIQ